MSTTKTVLRSRAIPKAQSGTQIELTRRRAGWDYVGFAVRQIAAGESWSGRTGGDEVCLVLLSGLASIAWISTSVSSSSRSASSASRSATSASRSASSASRAVASAPRSVASAFRRKSAAATADRRTPEIHSRAAEAGSHSGERGRHVLGPRRDVFSDYPHAVYLPPKTSFELRARRLTEIAECRSPTSRRFPPRAIGPADCGLEVRGGGNATRQIIDILPPAAEADRLLVCEVLTPAGNWSSYPPHKHDRHQPPTEADLEETYYYRFSGGEGYGVQRLYTADDRQEQVLRVVGGDLVLVREGYHPFVAAPGFDAYYLNTLAGSFRSMAATDDPRYAYLRASWPPPDVRVPLLEKPAR